MNKYAGSSKEFIFIIVIVDQINKTYFENEVVQEIKICQLKKNTHNIVRNYIILNLRNPNSATYPHVIDIYN
jgi:hypothetical protein